MTLENVSPLAMLRRLRFMSQEELGKAIGVTGNTVARWERGEVQPRLTPKQYKQLAQVLHVKPEDLPDDFGPQPIHDTAPRTTQN